MLQIGVTSIAHQCRDARRAVRNRLARVGIEAEHVAIVEEIVQELLVAVFDSHVTDPIILTVTPSEDLTHVSVKAPSAIRLRDEPFGLRERILDKLTVDHGQHLHANGNVDLWAAVARSGRG